MKKLIITCALLTFGTLASFAQNAQSPQTATTMQAAPRQMPQVTSEQRAERRAKSEEKQLGLTPEQYKAVYAADLEMVNKMEALRTNGKQPQRADFEAISAAKDEKFSKILTADQMTKYKAMMNRQHQGPSVAPGQAAPTGK